MAPIPQPLKPPSVVPAQHLANPLPAISGNLGHLRARLPLGQQPHHLNLAAGDRIARLAVVALQRLHAQMLGNH